MDGNLANAGDVEGVDRKSTTVTEKPAAAAKAFPKNGKVFFILNQISAGFEPLPPANYHLKLTTHNLTSANYHLKPTTNNLTPKIYHLQSTTHNPQPNT